MHQTSAYAAASDRAPLAHFSIERRDRRAREALLDYAIDLASRCVGA